MGDIRVIVILKSQLKRKVDAGDSLQLGKLDQSLVLTIKERTAHEKYKKAFKIRTKTILR